MKEFADFVEAAKPSRVLNSLLLRTGFGRPMINLEKLSVRLCWRESTIFPQTNLLLLAPDGRTFYEKSA